MSEVFFLRDKNDSRCHHRCALRQPDPMEVYAKKKKDAILGYTGLVGSHLREGLDPENTDYFNTKNFGSVTGKEYENVYCACIPAVKWWANKNRGMDRETIREIVNVVRMIRCEKLILISTIDVHDMSMQLQTEQVEHPSREPYGSNRRLAEELLLDAFNEKLFIIRLPALFGAGLKKNVLFDLIHDNRVEYINGNSAFQWYPLWWLLKDIHRFISCPRRDPRYRTLNLYPEPIETMDIIHEFPVGEEKCPAGRKEM